MHQRVFSHRGDIGDIIASLSTVKAMGGGDYLIFDVPEESAGGRRESMRGARFDAIKPLLESQPYIGRVGWSDTVPEFDYNFSGFRHDQRQGEDLATWQARYLGVQVSLDPWLIALRSPKSLGRVVVARSGRYQNPDFPWRRIVSDYRKKILFVGLPEEHRAFQIQNGCIVEYCPTENLLELAEVIAGCELFIGNQSCPFWIAAGLGVNLVQESFRMALNSIIKRPNAKYLVHPPYNL